MSLKIYVVGMGVGSVDYLTLKAKQLIESADLIIGAKRMLSLDIIKNKAVACAYLPKDVVKLVGENENLSSIVVLMSGDIGFFSGATKLYEALENYDVQSVCGISSPVYFSSKLKMPWDNIKLVSMHGRHCNIVSEIKTNFRVFTLVGGDSDINSLCTLLCKYNLNDLRLYVGENLSYEDEKITVGTAIELKDKSFNKLACVIIENENYSTAYNFGIDDNEFERVEKVPMTKSEVRAVSLAKLKLNKSSVIYDVGAGTGSVSIEMALMANAGTVYAIEKNELALNAINNNVKKFGINNIRVINAYAPSGFEDLESPTHAFIGGSSGNLKEIISAILKKNENTRIVINTVSLESLSESVNLLKFFNFDYTDIVQVSVAKSKKLGNYNMMMGQNPIYIITCQRGESDC